MKSYAIPPVVASQRYWGPAPTVITITTSISTFLNEVMVIVSANGMCANRRLPESQARMSLCQFPDQLSPVGTENGVFVSAAKAGIRLTVARYRRRILEITQSQ